MLNSFPQVMTIAGSDSDGSAGAQADLNTFFARGVYGMSVLTACVAGNSFGIHASQALTPSLSTPNLKQSPQTLRSELARQGCSPIVRQL